MRFVVDAQLPPALARWLSAREHAAEHVADLGLTGAADRSIWEYCVAADAAIITKDEDFAMRRAVVASGPAVVWIRCGNTSNRELLTWIRFRLPTIVAALERGESLIEIA